MRALIFFVICVALLWLFALLPEYGSKADGTAGRYHQRTRVGNFFDRGEIAGRYHQRTRAGRFFNRGAC